MSSPRLMVLDALSILGLIAAAGITMLPGVLRVTAVEPEPKTNIALPIVHNNAADSNAMTVVAANMLSGSRHAPTVHYQSPDVDVMQAFTPAVVMAKPDSTAANRAANGDVVPGLYGIVNVDGTWRALLRLSNSDANPTLFKEGDRRGAFRVVSILSDRVVLAGASGQRTLRLARSAPGDSTAQRP